MSRFVIDSSLAFKWFVPEADSPKAIAIRDDLRNSRRELIAPDVFYIELAHALTRAERQKRMAPPRGTQFLADALKLNLGLHPSVPLLPRATELSSQMRMGVYDCLYLALAEREGCDFITADDKLVKNASAAFPFVVSLSSLP